VLLSKGEVKLAGKSFGDNVSKEMRCTRKEGLKNGFKIETGEMVLLKKN